MINFKRINKTMLYKLVKEFAGISDLPKMKDFEFDFYSRTDGKRGRSRNCYLVSYQNGYPDFVVNYFCYETSVHFFIMKSNERTDISLDMDWLTENGYIELDEAGKAKLQNEPAKAIQPEPKHTEPTPNEPTEPIQPETEHTEPMPNDTPAAEPETGVLVLDMPKTCAGCVYSQGYFCSANIDIHSLAVHPTRTIIPPVLFDIGRPDWCPIRAVPNTQDICSNPLSNTELSYRLGWNTCRDAILYGTVPIRNG